MRQRHQSFDHELIGSVADTVGDELAVNLEIVERNVLEIVEAAEAAAEIIERKAAAELMEALSEVSGQSHL